MKKFLFKKALASVLSAAMLVSVLPQTNLTSVSAAKKYVGINTSFKTLKTGQSYKLKLRNNTLHWKIRKVSTSNKKICTVYKKKASSVLLKGKSSGRAVIKIKIQTNKRKKFNKKTLKCSVRVISDSVSKPQPAPITAYTVTFQTNGGNFITAQTVESGKTAAKPEDPAKDGYVFKGWYLDADFENAYDFTNAVTEHITLYAKWNHTYTVKFQTNGGNKIEDQIVESGSQAAQPSDPVRAASIFDGWYRDGQLKEKYDFLERVTKNITIYARWKVKYDNLPSWNYPVGNNTGSSSGNSNGMTVKYTVTFNTNGGSNVKKQTVRSGDKAEEPANPVKEGYTFEGWFLDTECNEAYEFDEAVSKDIILYAKWMTVFDEKVLKTDADKDNVPAYLEEVLGTSEDLEDSDHDGISDYIEIYEIGSDPAAADSDQDTDGDGISNIDEVNKYHTNAGRADTDADGLNDYEELFIYKTDPLKADTDGDGISDGDEIKIGSDPNEMTELMSVQQVLSEENIEESLNEDNAFLPSVSGKAGVIIDHKVTITESTDESVTSNRAVLGKGVNVTIPENEKLTLTFTSNEAVSGTAAVMELNETGWILAESSKQDGNTLSANIDHSGVYCVVDVSEMLHLLGIDAEFVYEDIQLKKEESSAPEEELPEERNISETDAVPGAGQEESGTDYVQGNVQEGFVELDPDIEELINTASDFSMQADTAVMGQADIVFAIDTTGSMSGVISNAANNVILLANTLVTKYHANANFALVQYKDILEDGQDSTVVMRNGNSNWFTTIGDFKNAVASLRANGGGDTDETAVDALEASRMLNFRSSAKKFIILITDAGYKVANNYGIGSMQEMTDRLAADDIVVSVVTTSGNRNSYQDLYEKTNGMFADIRGNFSEELEKLADLVGEEVNKSNWILLDDLQYIALDHPLAADGGDTDGDGVSDYDELLEPIQMDLTIFLRFYLHSKGITYEDINKYLASEDKKTITVYPYKSNPAMPDTDFDGVSDKDDANPRSNVFKGKLYGFYDMNDYEYTMDFTRFFRNKQTYSKKLAVSSLLFADTIYGYGFDGSDKKLADIKEIMQYHGFDKIADYSLKDGYNDGLLTGKKYDDDDVSQVLIGYHDVVRGKDRARVVGVFVRGTNNTIEEWSSNFDVGNLSEWEEVHHKGFYTAEERIREFLYDYIQTYHIEKDAGSVTYWITGHSRGAAVSNLLAAKLIDDNKNVAAYTFATPSATTDKNMGNEKYNSIFNFTNVCDVVTYVPLSSWGFGKYGITKDMRLDSEDLETEWHKQTGNDYSALNEKVINLVLKRIHDSCCSKWKDVHKRAGRQLITQEQYNCISKRAMKYCDIKNKIFPIRDQEYIFYPSMAFVLQLGAEALGGSEQEKKNILPLIKELWNSKYGAAIAALIIEVLNDENKLDLVLNEIPTFIHGTFAGDGHAPATYYVLIK